MPAYSLVYLAMTKFLHISCLKGFCFHIIIRIPNASTRGVITTDGCKLQGLTYSFVKLCSVVIESIVYSFVHSLFGGMSLFENLKNLSSSTAKHRTFLVRVVNVQLVEYVAKLFVDVWSDVLERLL